MNERVLRYQLKDTRISILKFWLTMLIVNIFIFFVNKYSPTHTGSGLVVHTDIMRVSIVGINLFALGIFLLVQNYENYYKIFPMLLGFSITRKDYALSLIRKAVFISLSAAIIQGLLFLVDPLITTWAGKNILYEYGVFNLRNDNIIYLTFSLFIVFLSFSSLWNLIASLNYRLGYKMWIIGFAIFYSGFFFGPLKEINFRLWKFFGQIFTTRVDFLQFGKLFLLIVLSQALTYFNNRNLNIRVKA